MAKSTPTDPRGDLREFVKENDQRVHTFCALMLDADLEVEERVLAIFREFGSRFRKTQRAKGSNVASARLQTELFQIAWHHIHGALHAPGPVGVAGRDTRLLQGLDDDLLRGGTDRAEFSRFRDRLSRVAPELRAPVILRDILSMDDERVAQTLGLRWGVYRHRLHRGRLDLKDALKGLVTGQPIRSEVAASA